VSKRRLASPLRALSVGNVVCWDPRVLGVLPPAHFRPSRAGSPRRSVRGGGALSVGRVAWRGRSAAAQVVRCTGRYAAMSCCVCCLPHAACCGACRMSSHVVCRALCVAIRPLSRDGEFQRGLGHTLMLRVGLRCLVVPDRCRCGRNEPSPSVDVEQGGCARLDAAAAGGSPAPVRMWRCRCEPSPGADVGGAKSMGTAAASVPS
jgi:hypothetical protein